MGKSLTRKIIEAHYVSGSMKAGEEVFIKVDQTLTHDINAVMTYLAFEAIGLDRIRTECSGKAFINGIAVCETAAGLFIQALHCRDPFCGSFILDQAGVNTIKFSIFQLSPTLHIFALL